ncbi:hypothetical protein PVAP13_8KG055484 [Panicum virgatum]|uniref:Uncharacterized protein n=1 Tax=Panicum virgatum TaxID=38727 RepID=A0A8T0PFD9_PANVG|nr:hypothetical protein PVAP13_8KG057808 [Panicum virgatum]KAG2560414.1 hypothetical protein PVAP13_8KG055484 [Panicum virgatum]
MISFKYICYTRQLISCDWGFSLWVCMQNIPKKRSTSPPQRSWPSLLLGWSSSLELFSSRRHFSCPDSPPLPSLLLQGLPSASRVPTSAGATRRSSHGVSTRSSCPSSTTDRLQEVTDGEQDLCEAITDGEEDAREATTEDASAGEVSDDDQESCTKDLSLLVTPATVLSV